MKQNFRIENNKLGNRNPNKNGHPKTNLKLLMTYKMKQSKLARPVRLIIVHYRVELENN